MVHSDEAHRWMGAAHSEEADAATAGRRAASEAAAGRTPTLMIAFASTGYDFEQLLDGVRSQAHDETVIVGCTTAGEIAAGRSDQARAGVAVTALGGPGLQARAEVGRAVSTRRREAGAEAAAAAAGLDAPNRVSVMLCDGLAGDQHEVVRGAYDVLGAGVPLVGGCAGDDFQITRTHQFIGGRDGVEILSDAVIGVGLGSDGALGVGMAHGWHKSGEAMVVSRSDKGRVLELDDRPALDVYLERIGADRSLLEIPGALTDRAMPYPIGMSRRKGEDLRAIYGGDASDGSLLCLAEVPEGALVWIMAADGDSVVRAGAASLARAIEDLDGAAPIGLLAFDCVSRKGMMGETGVRQEVAAMADVAAGVPLTGFFTYGEISRTQGARGMHHLTVVTLAVS